MTKKIKINMERVYELRQEGKTFKEIGEIYDCHRSTVNRRYNNWLKRNKLYNKGNKSWFNKVKCFFANLFATSETKWK